MAKDAEKHRTKFVLEERHIPEKWYNIQADLPTPLPPPLHPGTKQPLGPQDLARWSSGPPTARLCADLAARRPGQGGHRIGLHDPVAVVAALDPELFRWEQRRLRCAGGDAPPGALVAVAGPPSAAIAVAIDAAAVRDRIVEAVLAAGRAEHG